MVFSCGASGYSVTVIPWLFAICGAVLFAGKTLGGRSADRSVVNAVQIFSILLFLLLLLGLGGFATGPGLQSRVMRHMMGAATLSPATKRDS